MGKLESKRVEDVQLTIPFKPFSIVTVSLPAVSLLYCFLHGMLFRFSEVNETVCQAHNIVPSISAVTGITPGAYFWRICIGLHATPRFAVGFMHYNYYIARISYVDREFRPLFKKLLSLNFWLYTIENSCLVGVTYISNKENYPVHEKIFVVFMVASCCYMLLNTLIYKWTRTDILTPTEKKSLKIKWIMFACIMTATTGLLTAFILHRVFCVAYAFSFFSAFEYVIAYSNMGYHVSAYLEFKNKSILAADLISDSVYTNGDAPESNAITQDSDEDRNGSRRSLRIRKKGAGESVQ
ncbi:post-GPI attachment to proteins factor 2-like [Saccostrea cucullata]|uniref:post-GPI attachment to proteins factor 2-like n=1 Tax=Saccostrea cuccullata TaxID=36930 RepID=UPI002ED08CDF